jgi:hypothetical protein
MISCFTGIYFYWKEVKQIQPEIHGGIGLFFVGTLKTAWVTGSSDYKCSTVA